MPTISIFYGIVIRMYWSEHSPPHFHAYYSGAKASFEIETGERLEGSLPARAQRLVREWADIHRSELMTNWGRARAHLAPYQIDPLP